MTARTVRAYVAATVVMIVGCILLAAALAFSTHAIADRIDPPAPAQPGAEWQRDHGSIWWTCTRDGRALIRDADTGSTMLDRDDRKCDSGG